MRIVKSIAHFPLAVTRFVLLIVITFYYITVGYAKLKRNGFSRGLQQWEMRSWGNAILWVMGIRIKLSGQPNDGNFILMPNHRSYVDIPLIVKFFQGTLVGKMEVGKWPMARTAAKITRPILVNRSDLKSLVATMNKIKDSVDKQIPVILFPEGTTHQGPLTKTFKNGSFKIAADMQIPIIPVAIHYPDSKVAWVGNDTFIGHFLRQMGKPRTKAFVRIGQPVSSPDYLELKTIVRSQIDEMLKDLIQKESHGTELTI